MLGKCQKSIKRACINIF